MQILWGGVTYANYKRFLEDRMWYLFSILLFWTTPAARKDMQVCVNLICKDFLMCLDTLQGVFYPVREWWVTLT